MWTGSSAFTSSALSTTYTLTDYTVLPTSGTPTTTITSIHSTATAEAACTAVSDTYKQAAVDKHNQHRANHTANPLVWDDELACIAQRQANTCLFDHLM